MPSISLQHWQTTRSRSLDEIENAHLLIGGTGPGRRYATQQINQAYAVLLASQFQGYCRDLHSECVDHLVQALEPSILRKPIYAEFFRDRKLNRGNPNPGNIGADFRRLGIAFWYDVEAENTKNGERKRLLDELTRWRNAIAHQDFDPAQLGGRTTLQLPQVRRWRHACNGLARSFDNVMYAYVNALIGNPPW